MRVATWILPCDDVDALAAARRGPGVDHGPQAEFPATPSSAGLVAVIPPDRLPELDLVAVRVHHPGELAVLVRLRAIDCLDAGGLQLCQQRVEIVDAVIDHEADSLGAKQVLSPAAS